MKEKQNLEEEEEKEMEKEDKIMESKIFDILKKK